MALLQQWRDTAYSEDMDKNTAQKFWGTYFELEKNFYAELLENPDEEVKGTVKELAEKTADKDILKYYKHIEEISNMYPYQARLPYFIEF